MSYIKRRIKLAFTAATAVLLVGAAGELGAQQQTAKPRQEEAERAPYRSSIQVPNEVEQENEATEAEGTENEANEQDNTAEAGESGKYQALAKITAEQARSVAISRVGGTAQKAELENEDGNLVYSVEVKTPQGTKDVKVDAGNGRVLHVENGGDEQ